MTPNFDRCDRCGKIHAEGPFCTAADVVAQEDNGWSLIDDDTNSGQFGIMVICAGTTDPKVGYQHQGKWWDSNGFQLYPQPTHFLPGSAIKGLPKARVA